MVRNKFRVAAFFFVVCFLPFLRSCGDISVGFPAAAFSGGSILAIERVNGISLAVNLAFMALLCVTVPRLLRRISEKSIIHGGIRAVVIYHILAVSAYLITHPVYAKFMNHVTEYIAAFHLLVICPFFWIFDFQALDSLGRDSSLYGDMYDIKFRIFYVMMVSIWFGAGCAVSYIRARRLKG